MSYIYYDNKRIKAMYKGGKKIGKIINSGKEKLVDSKTYSSLDGVISVENIGIPNLDFNIYLNAIGKLNDTDEIVILCTGQSNMHGFGDTVLVGKVDNCRFWKGMGYWGDSLPNNSYATYIGRCLAQKYPNKEIRIINHSYAGQPISNWDEDNQNYIDMVNDVKDSLNYLNTNKISLLAWHQGESDYDKSIDYYLSKFNTMIINLEKEDFSPFKLPFVVGELSNKNPNAGISDINRALRSFNNDGHNHTGCALTSNEDTRNDNLHFTQQGYYDGGLKYVEIISKMIDNCSLTCTTNSKGEFKFKDFPVGEYEYSADTYSGVINLKDREMMRIVFNKDLKLGSLHGKVLFNSNPAENAECSIYIDSNEFIVHTDNKGYFKFDNLPEKNNATLVLNFNGNKKIISNFNILDKQNTELGDIYIDDFSVLSMDNLVGVFDASDTSTILLDENLKLNRVYNLNSNNLSMTNIYQTVSSRRGLYSFDDRTIDLSSANLKEYSNSTNLRNHTIFIVADIQSDNTIFSSDTLNSQNDTLFEIKNGELKSTFWSDISNGKSAIGGIPSNSTAIYSQDNDGNLKTYINNINVATSVSISKYGDETCSVSVGDYGKSVKYILRELIIFDSVLSETDRNYIYNGLKSKWNL